ncbi:MAG: hypothetical protein GTN36_06410 [Candidatus Aenigmarchaeota archaeon]|nr:hypothetical protein [Candidatus Aenigmarchaeota archaeon]
MRKWVFISFLILIFISMNSFSAYAWTLSDFNGEKMDYAWWLKADYGVYHIDDDEGLKEKSGVVNDALLYLAFGSDESSSFASGKTVKNAYKDQMLQFVSEGTGFGGDSDRVLTSIVESYLYIRDEGIFNLSQQEDLEQFFLHWADVNAGEEHGHQFVPHALAAVVSYTLDTTRTSVDYSSDVNRLCNYAQNNALDFGETWGPIENSAHYNPFVFISMLRISVYCNNGNFPESHKTNLKKAVDWTLKVYPHNGFTMSFGETWSVDHVRQLFSFLIAGAYYLDDGDFENVKIARNAKWLSNMIFNYGITHIDIYENINFYNEWKGGVRGEPMLIWKYAKDSIDPLKPKIIDYGSMAINGEMGDSYLGYLPHDYKLDKVVHRDGWETDSFYLLLDIAPNSEVGKSKPYANSIVNFVYGNEAFSTGKTWDRYFTDWNLRNVISHYEDKWNAELEFIHNFNEYSASKTKEGSWNRYVSFVKDNSYSVMFDFASSSGTAYWHFVSDSVPTWDSDKVKLKRGNYEMNIYYPNNHGWYSISHYDDDFYRTYGSDNKAIWYVDTPSRELELTGARTWAVVLYPDRGPDPSITAINPNNKYPDVVGVKLVHSGYTDWHGARNNEIGTYKYDDVETDSELFFARRTGDDWDISIVSGSLVKVPVSTEPLTVKFNDAIITTWDYSSGILTINLGGERSGVISITSTPIEDDLVGYWKFDGNTQDFSDYNNHGTPFGNPTWSTDCISGSCINFDGDGDYVRATTNGMLNYQGTIALWAKTSNVPSGRAYMFSHREESEINSRIYLFNLNGKFNIGLGDDSAEDTGYTFTVNQWDHFALTWSGANYNAYVNGEPVKPGSTSTPTSIASYLYMGSYLGTQEYFNGKIDEVKVFNRALSSSEIEAEYDGSNCSTRCQDLDYGSGVCKDYNPGLEERKTSMATIIANWDTTIPDSEWWEMGTMVAISRMWLNYRVDDANEWFEQVTDREGTEKEIKPSEEEHYYEKYPNPNGYDYDFVTTFIIRAYFQFRDDPRLTDAARNNMRDVLEFRAGTPTCQLEGREGEPLCYSENHNAMIASAGYFGNVITGGDNTANEQWLIDFLDDKLEYHYREFNSPTYMGSEFRVLWNLYDFAPSSTLRSKAKTVLDMLLAEHAVINVAGMRGGPFYRYYGDKVVDQSSDYIYRISQIYFDTPGDYESTPFPRIFAMFSSYEVPRNILDLAKANKEPFVFKSRRKLSYTYNNIPTYFYVTPHAVLATAQGDYPDRYMCDTRTGCRSHIWDISFGTSPRKVIFSGDEYELDGDPAYDEADAVQKKNILITSRSETINYVGVTPVYEDGWTFVQEDKTFVAIKELSNGRILVEVRDADDYGQSFSSFKSDIKDNALTVSGDSVTYENTFGETIVSPTIYTIEGDSFLYKKFDSPYLDSDWGSRNINIIFSNGEEVCGELEEDIDETGCDVGETCCCLPGEPTSCEILLERVQDHLNTECCQSGYDTVADVNKDGDINVIDMSIVVGHRDAGDETWCDERLSDYSSPCSCGGGGCPILKVWNGEEFVEIEKLDIHAPEYQDKTVTTSFNMKVINGNYEIILDEAAYIPLDGSHIDYVKLTDESGKECELISAVHSKHGDVLSYLVESDDMRIQTFPSENIKLIYADCSGDRFDFVIEGYNRIPGPLKMAWYTMPYLMEVVIPFVSFVILALIEILVLGLIISKLHKKK